jgi:hypothetical protein
MQPRSYTTMSFAAHRDPVRAALVADGHGASALVVKRTRIWAGGLSTAGATLPG